MVRAESAMARDHQTEIRLGELPLGFRDLLLAALSDLLRQGLFLLGVQERDLSDLLQVHPDRIVDPHSLGNLDLTGQVLLRFFLFFRVKELPAQHVGLVRAQHLDSGILQIFIDMIQLVRREQDTGKICHQFFIAEHAFFCRGFRRDLTKLFLEIQNGFAVITHIHAPPRSIFMVFSSVFSRSIR